MFQQPSTSERNQASESRHFLDDIQASLQLVFDELCSELKAENISIQGLLKANGNPKSEADFSVYLSPYKYPVLCSNLSTICDHVKTRLPLIKDCQPVGDHGVQLFLNRPTVYKKIFQNILCEKSTPSGNNKNFLLYIHDRTVDSLTNHRSFLIADHIMNILLVSGCFVFCPKYLSSRVRASKFSERIQFYDCSDCDSWAVHSDWFERCSVDATETKESGNHSKSLIIDPTEYLESRTDSRQYDSTIKQICIRDKSYTDSFKESAFLYHILKTHCQRKDIAIFHIIPVQKRISAQKCGILLEMSSGMKIKQLYLTCQTAISKDNPDLTIKQFNDKVSKGIEFSFTSKYGSEATNDDIWMERTRLLTDTVVEFDFLMTSPSTPLNLPCGFDDGYQDKGGSFVQYNCARMAVIFQKHAERVKSGEYEELPNVDDIDFTFLKQQDEWNLFSKYVLPYSKILEDLMDDIDCNGESVEVSVATHRISRMLVNLSRDLSLYYNKSRVLVEPVPKLFPRMNARLYLLKAIHYVIENALSLMSLSAVDRM